MTAPEIDRVCFIGAGTMGCFNSLLAALGGVDAVVHDIDGAALASVPGRQREIAAMLAAAGRCDESSVELALQRVSLESDLDRALAQVKQQVGFYVGGMGAKSFNVHKDHISRFGFGEAAEEIQRLFMSGQRDQAMAAVPDQLADEISLCGPKERIRERLQAWQDSPVTQLVVGSSDAATLAANPATQLSRNRRGEQQHSTLADQQASAVGQQRGGCSTHHHGAQQVPVQCAQGNKQGCRENA